MRFSSAVYLVRRAPHRCGNQRLHGQVRKPEPSLSPERLALVRKFMEEDTGDDLVMVNVIADLLEPDILALESVAQEVLTGSSEGPAAAHSSDLEVARIFGLREATWILLC